MYSDAIGRASRSHYSMTFLGSSWKVSNYILKTNAMKHSGERLLTHSTGRERRVMMWRKAPSGDKMRGWGKCSWAQCRSRRAQLGRQQQQDPNKEATWASAPEHATQNAAGVQAQAGSTEGRSFSCISPGLRLHLRSTVEFSRVSNPTDLIYLVGMSISSLQSYLGILPPPSPTAQPKYGQVYVALQLAKAGICAESTEHAEGLGEGGHVKGEVSKSTEYSIKLASNLSTVSQLSIHLLYCDRVWEWLPGVKYTKLQQNHDNRKAILIFMRNWPSKQNPSEPGKKITYAVSSQESCS